MKKFLGYGRGEMAMQSPTERQAEVWRDKANQLDMLAHAIDPGGTWPLNNPIQGRVNAYRLVMEAARELRKYARTLDGR